MKALGKLLRASPPRPGRFRGYTFLLRVIRLFPVTDLVGDERQFRPVTNSTFGVDFLDVASHGKRGDMEVFGDFSVGHS